jgi:hypothetical protein
MGYLSIAPSERSKSYHFCWTRLEDFVVVAGQSTGICELSVFLLLAVIKQFVKYTHRVDLPEKKRPALTVLLPHVPVHTTTTVRFYTCQYSLTLIKVLMKGNAVDNYIGQQ